MPRKKETIKETLKKLKEADALPKDLLVAMESTDSLLHKHNQKALAEKKAIADTGRRPIIEVGKPNYEEGIVDIASGFKPFKLQQNVLNSTARFRSVVAGVRGGKTKMGAFDTIKYCLENQKKHVWSLSPTYKMLKVPMADVDDLLYPFPELIVERNRSDHWIKFVSGSLLEYRSTELVDTLRGPGLDRIWADEPSYMREEASRVMRTRVSDTLGGILYTTTPRGRNWVYRDHMKGWSEDHPNFQSFHWTSKENPYFPIEEWEDAKADLPADFFAQEYMAQFLDDVAGVFRGVADIIQLKKITAKSPFVMGLDLGKHKDFTVMHVMDCMGQTADWLRMNELAWTEQKEQAIRIANKWKALIVMDSTGLGDPIYDELVERLGSGRVVGMKFTQASKAQMVRALQSAIEHKHVTIINQAQLIDELKWFEYKQTRSGNLSYNAPEGFHDDCVWALALANWGRMHYLLSAAPVIVDIMPETRRNIRKAAALHFGGVGTKDPKIWKNSRMNRIFGGIN